MSRTEALLLRALEASLRGERGFAQRALVLARGMVEAWEHALESKRCEVPPYSDIYCTKLVGLNERVTGVRVKLANENARERALRALAGEPGQDVVTASLTVGYMRIVEHSPVELLERSLISATPGYEVKVNIANTTGLPCNAWVTFLGNRMTPARTPLRNAGIGK